MNPNEELKPETKLPEGILRFAGRKAGGGLAAVGNVLDLPGSTARDLLTWVPGGMEAQNPLDQWIDPLGYNAEENRVYGREVLRANNMADQADTNGNFWGGLAYDVVTDPLLYLTGGLTKAGEAISKTGARALARPAANLKAAKMAKEATGNGAARLLRPIRGIGARAKVTPQDIFDSITDEAARAQAYDEFLKAGGTDAMLNEPLSAIKLKVPLSGYINQIQKKFTGKDLPEAFVRGVEILKTNPSRAMERFVNNNLDRAKAGSAVDDTVPPPDGAGPVDPINPGDGPGPVGPVDPVSPAPMNPVDAGDIEDLVNTYGLTPEEAAGVVERNKNWIDQNRNQVGSTADEAATVADSTAGPGSLEDLAIQRDELKYQQSLNKRANYDNGKWLSKDAKAQHAEYEKQIKELEKSYDDLSKQLDQGGSSAPSTIAESTFAPTVVDGVIDYADTSARFSALSPAHDAYQTNVISPLVKSKVLTDGDGAWLQSILSQSDMTNIPEGLTAQKLTSKNLSKFRVPDNVTGVQGVYDPKINKIGVAAKDHKLHGRAEVLLHETGHSIFIQLQKTDEQLFNAAYDAIERDLYLSGGNSQIKKYLQSVGVDDIDHLTSKPSEAFSQLFAAMSASKVKPKDLPGPIMAAVQKVWEKVLDFANRAIGALPPGDAQFNTIKEMVEYAGGYVPKAQRDSILKRLDEYNKGKGRVLASADDVSLMKTGDAALPWLEQTGKDGNKFYTSGEFKIYQGEDGVFTASQVGKNGREFGLIPEWNSLDKAKAYIADFSEKLKARTQAEVDKLNSKVDTEVDLANLKQALGNSSDPNALRAVQKYGLNIGDKQAISNQIEKLTEASADRPKVKAGLDDVSLMKAGDDFAKDQKRYAELRQLARTLDPASNEVGKVYDNLYEIEKKYWGESDVEWRTSSGEELVPELRPLSQHNLTSFMGLTSDLRDSLPASSSLMPMSLKERLAVLKEVHPEQYDTSMNGFGASFADNMGGAMSGDFSGLDKFIGSGLDAEYVNDVLHDVFSMNMKTAFAQTKGNKEARGILQKFLGLMAKGLDVSMGTPNQYKQLSSLKNYKELFDETDIFRVSMPGHWVRAADLASETIRKTYETMKPVEQEVVRKVIAPILDSINAVDGSRLVDDLEPEWNMSRQSNQPLYMKADKNLRNYEIGDNAVGSVSTRLVEGRAEAARIAKLNKKQVVSELRNHGGKVSTDKPVEELRDDLLIKSLGPNKYRAVMEEHNASVLKPTEASPPPAFSAKSLVKDMNDGSTLYRSYHKTFAETGIATDGHFAVVVPESLRPEVLKSIGKIDAEVNSLPESALKNVLAEGTESASIIGQSKAHVSSMFDRAGDLYIVHGLSGNLQLVNKSYADNILSMYPSASVSLDGSRVVFSDGGRVVGAVMSVDYSKLSKNTQNIISNYPNVIKSTATVAGRLTNLDDVAAAVKAAGEPYGIIDPAQLKKLIKVVKEKNPDGSVSYRVDDSGLVKAYGPASDIDPAVAAARRADQQAALDAAKARETSASVGSTEAVANAAQKQIDKPKPKRGGLRKRLDARLEAIASDPALDKGDELDRLLAEQSGLPPTNNLQVVNAGGDLVQRPDVVIPNTAQQPDKAFDDWYANTNGQPVPPVEPPIAGGSGGGAPPIEPPAPPMAGAEPPMGPVDPINPGAAEPPPLPPSQPPRVGPNNTPETLGNRIYDYMTDAADRLGDFAYMIPGVAATRALFTPEIKGALTEEGRAVGRMVSLQEEQMIQGARARLFGMVKNLDESRLLDEDYLVKSGMSKTEAIDIINSRGGEILSYLEGRSAYIPKWMEPIVDSLNSMRREYDDMLVKENEDGIKLADVNDLYSEYVRRLMRSPSKEKVEIKGSTDPNRGPVINTRHKSQMARAEEYRDLPGGTSVINEMSIDGNISGIMHISPMIKKGLETADMVAPRIDTPAGKVSLREYVFANYGDQLLDGEALKNYNPAKSTDLDALIRKVANYDRGYVDTQMPIFGRDPMYDLWVRMQDSLRTRLVGRAAMDMLGKAAVAEKYADFPKDQLVRMDKMLDDLKIWNPNAVRHMIASASPEIQKTLATNIDNEAAYAMSRLGEGKTIRYRVGDDEFVITPEMDGKTFTGNATVLHKKGTFASEPYTKEIKVDGVDPVTRNPASVLVEKTGKRIPEELNEIEVTPEFIRGTVTDKATIDTAKLFGVHKSLWDESNRFMKPFSDPEAVSNILGAARAFTNLFKTGATAAFPAFHVRNLFSGQINNALHGAYDPRFTGYKRFYQPVKDALELNQGKPFEGITDIYNGGLTPEKAMEELQKEMFSTGLLAEKQGIAAETLGDSIDKLANQIPGQNQLPNPLQAAKKVATTRPAGTGMIDAINPLGAKGGWTVGKDGVKQLNDDTFLLYRWGRDTAAFTEFMNRAAPFIAFRRQGFSAIEAKRMVDRIQVDYSNLTPFERKYMRLVMPFYTYSRNVMPTVLEDLVKRPGGPTATMIKTANHLRDPNASVPEHISSTMAIPWGQGEDGTQSYITGFGLPFEDTLNLLNGPVRLDPSESLREVLGRSNPIVKGVYEQASGRSAFWDGPDVGGRPLSELDPPIGRTVANISDMITGEQTKRADPIFGSQGLEYLAAASPFGRFTTTARQLTDQRKLSDPINLALNILSGVRVNDVSPEAQDSLLRDRIGVILKEAGARKFSRDYLPTYAEEKLSPEQKKEVELLLEALKSIDKRFKERRLEKESK